MGMLSKHICLQLWVLGPWPADSWPALSTSVSAYQWEAGEMWLRPEGALLSFNNTEGWAGIFISVPITHGLNTVVGQNKVTKSGHLPNQSFRNETLWCIWNTNITGILKQWKACIWSEHFNCDWPCLLSLKERKCPRLTKKGWKTCMSH